jgi:branched-chain amino acid transport system ATP-binding protein
MSENVLRVENATMQFGGVVAVDNLNLEINEGEIVSLIGPNGAGKTTAFNVITGVYAPSNGRVEFCGETIVRNHPRGKMKKLYKGQNPELYTSAFRVQMEDAENAESEEYVEKKAALEEEEKERDPAAFTDKVLSPTPDLITKLGMARTFQNIRLWKSQTVFDNILIAKHLRRTSNLLSATFRLNRREEAAQRTDVERLLEIVGLSEAKDELATSLPYGKQRRLEIARALATEPKLLLLDEPAAGMNPQETNDLTEFIGRIRSDLGLTVFLIEHHMDLVMDISDRIYVLDFGGLIAKGTPAEIQNNQRVIDAYLGVAEDA